MRHKFINVCCRKTAIRRAPWACRVTKVSTGYLAFESVVDYDTWRLTNRGCAPSFGVRVKEGQVDRAAVVKQETDNEDQTVQAG